MEKIARAAGVGKGTLYRRYPDRAAITVALLDEHERALQEQLYRYQRQQRGRSVEEITAALTDLARAVLAQAG